MNLAITEGADVYTAEGEPVGSVDVVVVDPLTRAATHIVVRKGLLFRHDRVVSIDQLSKADGEGVVLEPGVAADSLPPFEERHYVPFPSDADIGGWAAPVALFGPYGMPLTPVADLGRMVVERNIPERGITIESGTEVTDASGDRIGYFSELVMTSTGAATHLVVDVSGLSGMRKALPVSWIENLSDDSVRLGVTRGMVEAVPRYDPEDLAIG